MNGQANFLRGVIDGVPVNEFLLYCRFVPNENDYTGLNTITQSGGEFYPGLWNGLTDNSIRIFNNYHYINCLDNDRFTFSDSVNDKPFSISINFLTELSATGYIIHKRGSVSTVDDNSEWMVYFTSDNRILVRLFDSLNSGYIEFNGSTIIPDETATHLIVRYDGYGNVKIMINGVDDTVTKSQVGIYETMRNNSTDVKFSSAYVNFSYAGIFKSKRSGTGIWNKKLSDSECLLVYNKETVNAKFLL